MIKITFIDGNEFSFNGGSKEEELVERFNRNEFEPDARLNLQKHGKVPIDFIKSMAIIKPPPEVKVELADKAFSDTLFEVVLNNAMRR